MPALNHPHSYIRVPVAIGQKKSEIFKCNDPHCSHSNQRKLLNNAASLCPRCGSEFKLNWQKLQRAVPLCDNCSNTKEARQKRAARELIESLVIQGETQQ